MRTQLKNSRVPKPLTQGIQFGVGAALGVAALIAIVLLVRGCVVQSSEDTSARNRFLYAGPTEQQVECADRVASEWGGKKGMTKAEIYDGAASMLRSSWGQHDFCDNIEKLAAITAAQR